MKKLTFTLLILMFFNISYAQWQWAKGYGSPDGYGGPGNLCLDDSGNIYMTGSFGTPYGVFGTDTLPTNNSLGGMFILKTDNSGNLIWDMNQFGIFEAGGSDIKFDPVTKSIITCGYVVNGYTNPYLKKEDLDGNTIWGGTIDPPQAELGSITLDNNGNIYILGFLKANGIFKGFSLPAGNFIAKFSAGGTCIFAKNVVGVNDYVNWMKYVNSSLLICGTAISNPIVVDTAHALNHGGWDNFIARFDTIGNVTWLKSIGGPNLDGNSKIDVDGQGNIYTTGIFKDTAYLDSLTLINNSSRGVYFSKWDINGNLIWAKQITATPSIALAFINALTTNSNGITYITGYTVDTVHFGGGYDIYSKSINSFVARYDSSGNCIGLVHFGYAQGQAIVSDGNDAFYIAGLYHDSVQIGGTTLNPYYTGTSFALGNIYLAKHDIITIITEGRHSASNQLEIYANPTAGKCNIKVPDDFMNEKNLIMSIFDNTGRQIQQSNLEMNEGKIKMSLDAIAKGVYNVTLSNGKKSYSGRIVFQ